MKKIIATITRVIITVLIFGGTLELLATFDSTIFRTINGYEKPIRYEDVIQKLDNGYYAVPPNAQYRGIQFNQFGFNDENDYTLEKPAGQYRILIMGDSIAAATADDEPVSWPTYLEADLKQLLPGRDIEVINTATPNNGMDGFINQYRDYFSKFHPDLVIFYRRPNSVYLTPDSQTLAQVPVVEKAIKKSRFLTRLYQYRPQPPSKAYFIQRFRNLIFTVNTQPTAYSYFGSYLREINFLAETVQQSGATVWLSSTATANNDAGPKANLEAIKNSVYDVPSISLASYVNSIHVLNLMIEDLCIQKNIVFIDSDKTLGHRSENFKVNDNIHLSMTGKKRLARSIAQQIYDQTDIAVSK